LGALRADSEEDVCELADYRGKIAGLAVEFKGLKESFDCAARVLFHGISNLLNDF
jgi:hypothetical protein